MLALSLICPQPSVASSKLAGMAKVGQPELPRFNHSTVWTGTKMIVWGGTVFRGERPLYEEDGFIYENDGYAADDGGVYDPAGDVWLSTSTTGAPSARDGHSAVWAVERMIVWGGKTSNGTLLGDGYVYFPDSNTWRQISSANAPAARAGHTAVWTGTEMIVWGGGGRADGAAYNPGTDTWRPISNLNAPSARLGHGAVWCGDRMAVWGGSLPDSGAESAGTGSFYIPSSDSWTTISSFGAPSGGSGELENFGDRAVQLLWTGQKLAVLVINVADGMPAWSAGGMYDPFAQTWQPISSAGAPVARPYFGAWSGSALHIASSYGDAFRGCTYNFSRNRWEVKSTGRTGSFRGRMGVWSPERGELLVFGGRWITGNSDPLLWNGGPNAQRGFRIPFVTKRPQRIAFTIKSSAKVGDVLNLLATASSSLSVTIASSDSSVVQVNGDGTATALAKGRAVLTASQTGDASHAASKPVRKTVTVR